MDRASQVSSSYELIESAAWATPVLSSTVRMGRAARCRLEKRPTLAARCIRRRAHQSAALLMRLFLARRCDAAVCLREALNARASTGRAAEGAVCIQPAGTKHLVSAPVSSAHKGSIRGSAQRNYCGYSIANNYSVFFRSGRKILTFFNV